MRARLLTSTCVTAAMGLLIGPGTSHAQFERPLAGEMAERKIDQLRLDDSLLRAEINNAQISRQAEITRLEGRIMQLEEQLRDLPRGAGSVQLAFVLGLAASPDVASPDVASPVAEPEEKPQTVVAAENAAQQAGSEGPTGPSAGQQAGPSHQPLAASAVREIVVHDFMLNLEIELLDARSRLLEKSREVKSLERLSSKGLASSAQLEMQIMQRRRAELLVERFEKQIAGLRRVYPGYFEQ